MTWVLTAGRNPCRLAELPPAEADGVTHYCLEGESRWTPISGRERGANWSILRDRSSG